MADDLLQRINQVSLKRSTEFAASVYKRKSWWLDLPREGFTATAKMNIQPPKSNWIRRAVNERLGVKRATRS